jgi:hypothetical protein
MSNTKEPSGILPTPLGNINYTMTQADHVYLRTESAHDEALTVHRVRYHCCFHCYLVDGVWTAKDWHEPYLSRKGSGEPTPAARKAARETLAKAWTEFLAAHPGLTRQAALTHAEKCLDTLEEQVSELEEQLAAKRQAVREARETRNAIEMSTLLSDP